MDPFIPNPKTYNEINRAGVYSLRGVVRHIGNTANSGHYTTDALRSKVKPSTKHMSRDMTEDWVSFDDGLTTLRQQSDVMNDQKNPYMMVYQKAVKKSY